MIDCSRGRPFTNPLKVCKFDLDWLDWSLCIRHTEYGYEDGTPCFVFKLNRIYGWVPEPTDENIEAVGNESMAGVELECYGQSEFDKENMGVLEYWPYNYFPRFFYPYLGQDGYRDPLVFVRFASPIKNTLLMIECVAKAKNLVYEGPNKMAVARFEILVD